MSSNSNRRKHYRLFAVGGVKRKQNTGNLPLGTYSSAWRAPAGSRPQLQEIDTKHFINPFYLVPRLWEMAEWITEPSYALMWFLYWRSNVCRNLTRQLIALVIADGFKVDILKLVTKEQEEEIDEELTLLVADWLKRMGGKGRSVDNWIIPWSIIDNVITGRDSFYKYMGEEGDDEEEIGELMLKHLDPRSYVVVHQDFRDWRKLTQFPIVQAGISEDMTREQFETQFHPAVSSGRMWNFSSPGYVETLPPRDIPFREIYYFDFYLRAPMETVVDDIISKLQLKFFHIKGAEKYAFPLLLIAVPRHNERDADDDEFQEKLDEASDMGAEMRNGDSLAFPGEEYNDNGTILSKGWQVTPVDLKGHVQDFTKDIRMYDEQIAIGLFMNIAMISASGVQGEQTHQATGRNLIQETQLIGKTIRAEIETNLFEAIKDYVYLKKNIKLEDSQIKEKWSKIEEADAVAFFQIIFQSFTGHLMSFEETRTLMSRIGIQLKDVSQDEIEGSFVELGEEEEEVGEEKEEGKKEKKFDVSKLPKIKMRVRANE